MSLMTPVEGDAVVEVETHRFGETLLVDMLASKPVRGVNPDRPLSHTGRGGGGGGRSSTEGLGSLM